MKKSEDIALDQFFFATDGQPEADFASALELRADDIESGQNEAEVPSRFRKAVAEKLRSMAAQYKS